MESTADPQAMIAAMLAGAVRQGSLWHIIPPPKFVVVDRNNSSDAQGLSLAGTTALEVIQPPGAMYKGWVKMLTITCTNFSNTKFQFTYGQGGSTGIGTEDVREYNNIVQPYDNYSVFIPLLPGRTLTLNSIVTNGGVDGYRYRLAGWWYNQEMDQI